MTTQAEILDDFGKAMERCHAAMSLMNKAEGNRASAERALAVAQSSLEVAQRQAAQFLIAMNPGPNFERVLARALNDRKTA